MAYDKVVDSTALDGAMTATANAIRAKGGTSASIPWDGSTGFASAISAITIGGWLPPTAELVASNQEIINLSTDTSYDSWTPSGANATILDAGDTRAACSYTMTSDDISDMALVGLATTHTDYVYPSGTTMERGYQLNKTMYALALYVPSFSFFDYSDATGYTFSGYQVVQTYYYNAGDIRLYYATSYGIGPTSANPSVDSDTDTTSRTFGFTRPAIYTRCQAVYFSTTAAAELDSANTDITFDYRIYKMPKADNLLYAAFDATNGVMW